MGILLQDTMGIFLIQETMNQLNNMGLSENSVPLHPMVNDHYPY